MTKEQEREKSATQVTTVNRVPVINSGKHLSTGSFWWEDDNISSIEKTICCFSEKLSHAINIFYCPHLTSFHICCLRYQCIDFWSIHNLTIRRSSWLYCAAYPLVAGFGDQRVKSKDHQCLHLSVFLNSHWLSSSLPKLIGHGSFP